MQRTSNVHVLAHDPVVHRDRNDYGDHRVTKYIQGRKMQEHQSSDHIPAPVPPSFAEVVAALKTLNPPPAPEGISKHVATLVIATILGLGVYVVSGVSSMQSSIATIQATTSQSKTTLDSVQQDVKDLGQQQSDMKTQQAKLEARVTALENR